MSYHVTRENVDRPNTQASAESSDVLDRHLFDLQRLSEVFFELIQTQLSIKTTSNTKDLMKDQYQVLLYVTCQGRVLGTSFVNTKYYSCIRVVNKHLKSNFYHKFQMKTTNL